MCAVVLVEYKDRQNFSLYYVELPVTTATRWVLSPFDLLILLLLLLGVIVSYMILGIYLYCMARSCSLGMEMRKK